MDGFIKAILEETSGGKKYKKIKSRKNKKLTKAVCISITDSGIGIKAEDLNKIFSRFFQVKELDKQYYGGTGIGLEVVKSFVDLHKGKIDVVDGNLLITLMGQHHKRILRKEIEIETLNNH